MLGTVPIIPKNTDGVARIISIGRLSKPKATEAQTQLSLEAIRRENERMLANIYGGPKIVKYLAEQASGMLARRVTMDELWELVASGEWDAIVAEDLSRIFRNPRWQWAFVQDCVDAGIRVIAFADAIDTADENWETTVACATLRHGLMVPDTRRRIKRTATELFKSGGMVLKVRAFYQKLTREQAASGEFGPKGLRIRKLTEFAWVVDEIRRRLGDGQSPRSIVAWLNAEGIPCGPYVTSGRWTRKVLRELLEDPILHGTRRFRDVVHQPIFRTGKYRIEKNPTPEMEYVSELAFMTREEQEIMLATVGWEIDWGGVKPPQRPSPRKGISRYESYWPAQSATCSACGDKLYACGKYLRCSNSFCQFGQTCWNHVQASIAPLRAFVVNWLVTRCHASEAFRDVLLGAAKQQLSRQQSRTAVERDALGAKTKNLEGQERNLRKSIRIAEEISEEDLRSLVADLAAVTAQLQDIRREAASAAKPAAQPADYAEHEILDHLAEVLAHLLETSFEMAEVVRGFVPRCVIVPVQALDTGAVYARAKLFAREDMADPDYLTEHVVDLFDPPVHIRLISDAVRLREQIPRPTLKQIGAALGTSYMSIKRSLRYAKLMEELGLVEPYRELYAKPDKAARWRYAS